MYQAKVLRLHEDIEEDVTIEVCGQALLVFADLCPFVIRVGATYPIVLRGTLLGDQRGVASAVGVESIEALERGRYRLRGQVRGEALCACGLELALEWLPPDCAREEEWIEIEVDRISADFVPESDGERPRFGGERLDGVEP